MKYWRVCWILLNTPEFPPSRDFWLARRVPHASFIQSLKTTLFPHFQIPGGKRPHKANFSVFTPNLTFSSLMLIPLEVRTPLIHDTYQPSHTWQSPPYEISPSLFERHLSTLCSSPLLTFASLAPRPTPLCLSHLLTAETFLLIFLSSLPPFPFKKLLSLFTIQHIFVFPCPSSF